MVGVVKEHQYGGKDKKWRDYANFITIYHPHSGLFTQYAHLAHKGSFVTVGDSVTRGQAIGLSGKTGWTSIPHLHFNVLVPADSPEGLHSVEISFLEGYDGARLRTNDVVKK